MLGFVSLCSEMGVNKCISTYWNLEIFYDNN